MDKLKLNKGFTLVEVVIVMSIVMLLSMLTVNLNIVNKKSNKDYYKEVISNYKIRAFYNKTKVKKDNKVSECNINELFYNKNGNVNKAMKVYCNGKYMFNISIGIGSIYE